MTTTPGSLPLATLCGACDHTRMWHNTGGCVAHSCGCGLFTAPTAGQRPAPMDPVHILGVEATPDAARQARRKHLADLILRMRRGELHSQGRDILAAVLKNEQADADQAREQLAEAEQRLKNRSTLHAAAFSALGMPAAQARTASDVLVQHDVTRKALCDALDAGYHLNWQQLVDTAQRSHDANAEWQAEAEQHRHALADALGWDRTIEWAKLLAEVGQRTRDLGTARRGEAEAVRAREAAEAGERRAMEQRQQMAEERFTWQERGDRAEQRARGLEADLRGTEAVNERLRASLTAARAENDGWAETVRNTDRLTTQQLAEARQRAERAEATLTAVRKAVALAVLHEDPFRLACPQCATDHLAGIEAALGDPQPATEPADPCAHGCRQAADDLTRLGQEIDAEHTCPDGEPCPVPGHDEPALDGAALWAAIRDHAARDHQFWTDLNRDWERKYRQGVRL